MDQLIKRLIWLYLFLLVGEGVLRKWVLPGLSDPLLIIRDPLAIGIYLCALINGRFPFRASLFFVLMMVFTASIFAAINGTPPLVALYGIRIDFFHLPLIFIMADIFDREDVLRIGRAVMWLTIPISLLMIAQYLAGEYSWLNVGAGGDTGAQLRGALGKIRPPGPFSFITGPILWFPLATAFTFYGWVHRGIYSRWLLVPVTCLIFIVIPISVSRMLMLSVLVVVAFGIVTLLRNPQRALGVFIPLMLIALTYMAIGDGEMTEAFESRWEDSTQGGISASIFQRYLNEYVVGIETIGHAPIFGHGIGMGSNVGSRYSTGEMGFQLAEAEWAKIILELGPILGVAFIGFRVWLAVSLLLKAWTRLFTDHDSLSWLICGACVLTVISGQWAPPTILGFAVFGAGLTLAAAQPEDDYEDEDGIDEDEMSSDFEQDPDPQENQFSTRG